MDARQKRTFLVYSRGLMPDDLKLGSLYLDPANPLDGERKRFELNIEESELDKWVGKPEYDSPCILNFSSSRDWLINAGLRGLLETNIGRGKSGDVRIEGKNGRRLQIKRPELFLNQVVLGSPLARVWLARQLTISRTLYYLSRAKFGSSRYPRIWLVTGLQYMTQAEIQSGWSISSTTSLGFTVPIPEPTVAAVAGITGISGKASLSDNVGVTAAYNHEDERIWAAQFTRLKVDFHPRTDHDNIRMNTILLDSLEDLGVAGVRGEDGSEVYNEFAEITGVEEMETEVPEDMEKEVIKGIQDIDWDFFDTISDGFASET